MWNEGKRMNANRAIRIAAQRTHGLRIFEANFGANFGANSASNFATFFGNFAQQKGGANYDGQPTSVT